MVLLTAKRYGITGLFIIFSLFCNAQINLQQGKWKAVLQRQDGHSIPFELDIQHQEGKTVCYILNGTERIKTADMMSFKDSVLIRMPVFESYFRVKIVNKDSLNGVWIKGSTSKDVIMPFSALAGSNRFPKEESEEDLQVQGKWKVEFTRADHTKRPAIGEFSQQGRQVTGSVLTPSGDYRYLAGEVAGDSLLLSTFDGINALLLTAKITHESLTGNFYSGASALEQWVGIKDPNAVLTPPVTSLQEGAKRVLDFSFKDLEGNTVTLKDKRFKDKVVVLQLMGSWCPNCMDEMAFLSTYYRENKDRGIEIIALAYELTTNEERSRKSLQKFQQQFKVHYPILITGVTASDPQRTEKTLPQLTPVKVFPTTIILDRKGFVNKINTAFYGPGTGEYYTKYKQDFEKTMNTLLN